MILEVTLRNQDRVKNQVSGIGIHASLSVPLPLTHENKGRRGERQVAPTTSAIFGAGISGFPQLLWAEMIVSMLPQLIPAFYGFAHPHMTCISGQFPYFGDLRESRRIDLLEQAAF
jgi:hypothetical protein